MKPGLERLCERYRTKAAELGRDLLAYHEQHAAAVDAANDKNEENLLLEQQVWSALISVFARVEGMYGGSTEKDG